MKLSPLQWFAALVFSVGVHFGAVSMMQAPSAAVLTQGSAGNVAVVLLGDSATDATAAGAPSNTLDAQETEETNDSPADTVQESVSETQNADVEPAQESLSEPVEETIEGAVQEEEPIKTAALEQVATQTTHEMEDAGEVQPISELPIPAVRPKTHKAKRKKSPAPKAVKVSAKKKKTPKKKAKPRTTHKKSTKPVKKKSQKTRTKKKLAKKKSGSGGSSHANAQKKAAKGKASKKGSKAGNAAVSNYPGKVARRLRRSLRYPKSALRGKRSGQARVAFVITKSGKAKSIRITRSSGNPMLDKAALDAVRRASPFPAIPAAAGRTQWPFAVPISFKR